MIKNIWAIFKQKRNIVLYLLTATLLCSLLSPAFIKSLVRADAVSDLQGAGAKAFPTDQINDLHLNFSGDGRSIVATGTHGGSVVGGGSLPPAKFNFDDTFKVYIPDKDTKSSLDALFGTHNVSPYLSPGFASPCESVNILSFTPKGPLNSDKLDAYVDDITLAPNQPYNVIYCTGSIQSSCPISDAQKQLGGYELSCNATFSQRYALKIDNSPDPGVGSAGGNDQWYEAATSSPAVLPKSSFDRFTFISPLEIVDTQQNYSNGKPIVYKILNPDQVFNHDGGDQLFNDGVQFYWPVKDDGKTLWDKQGSSCLGGFAVETFSQDQWKNYAPYGSIFQIPTFSSGSDQKCYFGKTQSNVVIATISHYNSHLSGLGVDDDTLANNWRLDDTVLSNPDGKNRRMFYALFYWINDRTIGSFGNGGQNVMRSDTEANAITSSVQGLHSSEGTPRFYTACQTTPFYPFIEVPYNLNSSATDLDTDSSNTKGYTWIENNGSMKNLYQGNDGKCLTGQEIKNNWIGSVPYPPYAYIAYPSLASNNKAGHLGDDALLAIANKPPNAQSDIPVAHVDCDWSANPLTWFMCPLLDLTQRIINQVGGFITDQLEIDANKYFTTDSSNPIYQAWNGVRLISLSMLVIIALIMVIAQALSLEFVDAYTVKKVLPRLAIAVIAISLSWELLRLSVILSNDLARAVQSLILTPFGDLKNASIGGGQVSLAAVGGLVASQALGILGALSFLVTAAAALLIAFFAIILRQMLVILLVIVAPLAIIASILPNTQKLWKIWHESFFGALLVYSIITGFIVLGQVFGKIAEVGAGAAGPWIALVATYIPYFLIPKAFTMASGLVGTLGGMVNDRSRGVFDRLKKSRQGIVANRGARAKAGGIYGTNTRRGRFGNKLAGSVFEPHNYATLYGSKALGAMGFANNPLARRSSQIMGKIQNAKVEQSQEVFQHLNQNDFNDKAYQALTGAHRFKGNQISGQYAGKSTREALEAEGLWGKAPQTYEQYKRMGEILSNSDDDTESIGGRALMGQAGYLSTLNSSEKTNQASVIAAGAMGWSQHGFASADDLAAVHDRLAYDAAPGQRVGEQMAGALISRAQLFGQEKRLDAKLGYGDTRTEVNEKGERRAKSVLQNPKRLTDLIKTIKPHDYIGAKGGSIEDLAFDKDENGDWIRNADGSRKAREGGLLAVARGEAIGGDGKPVSADHQKAVRDAILQGASVFGGGDPDAKAAWLEMSRQAGLEDTVKEFDKREEERRRLEGTSGRPGAGSDPTAPYVPPTGLPG